MNGSNQITFIIHLTILAFGCCKLLSVKVERSRYIADTLHFTSYDKTLCQKANAIYLPWSSSYMEIVCRCKRNTVYYSYGSRLPKCRYPDLLTNREFSYTSSRHLSVIDSSRAFSSPLNISSDQLQCYTTPLEYSIKIWNGHTFGEFDRVNDFSIEKCLSDNCFQLQWKARIPVYLMYAYRGNLFLINVYCGSRKIQFMAFAEGTKSFLVDNSKEDGLPTMSTYKSSTWYYHPNKPKTSSKSKLLIYLGVVVLIVFFKVLLCATVYKRRRSRVITVRRLQTRRDNLAHRQNPTQHQNLNETNDVESHLVQTQPNQPDNMDVPPSYSETVQEDVGVCNGKLNETLSDFVNQPSIQSLDQLDDIIAYSDTKPLISK